MTHIIINSTMSCTASSPT